MKALRDIRLKLIEAAQVIPPIEEELNAEKDPADKWIADYAKSNDPRFKGKDKSARIKMALADFAAAQKASGKQVKECCSMDGGYDEEESNEVSMTRLELDEVADMADDLYNVLPNYDECPAWVQHKVAAIHAGLHSIYDYYRIKSMETQAQALAAEPIAVVTPQNPIVPLSPVPPAPKD